MMVPAPGTRWELEAGAFREAARLAWPDAELSEPYAAGNGNTEVMISTRPPGGGRPLSAGLSVEPDQDGSFSVQAGTGPEAAEMFAWFRAWIGPEYSVVILNGSVGAPLIEVPSGATAPEIRQTIQSLIF